MLDKAHVLDLLVTNIVPSIGKGLFQSVGTITGLMIALCILALGINKLYEIALGVEVGRIQNVAKMFNMIEYQRRRAEQKRKNWILYQQMKNSSLLERGDRTDTIENLSHR